MSTTSPHTPSTVSLADEEAVRRILVDTLFGLWATVNNLTRDGVWVRAHRARALGLRRVKQMCLALNHARWLRAQGKSS